MTAARHAVRVSCLLVMFLFFSALVHADQGLNPNSLSIIYIQANTGDSSGGHAALRRGQTVFHFQHSERGLLELKRENFQKFRFFYNDLGNRNMYESALGLSTDASDAVWKHFIKLLTRQGDSLARLNDLQNSLRLLESIDSNARSLPVKGAGFFQNDSDSSAWDSLSRLIDSFLEPDFIHKELTETKARLSRLQNAVPADIPKWQEQFSIFAALSIISERRALNPDAIVLLDENNASMGKLTSDEITALKLWKKTFENSILLLLESKRPDRGFPLMLACARYLCAENSIKTGRLFLLSTFPEGLEPTDAIQMAGDAERLNGLHRTARQKIRQKTLHLLNGDKDEYRWCMLENMGSRYAELEAAAKKPYRMRIYPENVIPEKTGYIPLAARPSKHWTEQAMTGSKKALKRLETKLGNSMGYNLFTNNCVTAIFSNISEALSSGQTGKQIDPELLKNFKKISFVPWRMFQQVTAHSQNIKYYPSWRQRKLASMYTDNNPVNVFLKECNTLTALTYKHGRQDSAFLFFTDNLALARPLFGAINLAWGLGRSAAGFFLIPFDSGTTIKSGALGALFSVPELFFLNIRKGSYTYLPQTAN